jgi:hypothetical protein
VVVVVVLLKLVEILPLALKPVTAAMGLSLTSLARAFTVQAAVAAAPMPTPAVLVASAEAVQGVAETERQALQAPEAVVAQGGTLVLALRAVPVS